MGKGKKEMKIYFTLILMLGFVSALIFAPKAHSMTAAEIEPGVIELNTTTVNGFSITEYAEKKVRGKTWVYFCVKAERSTKSAKCFYGLKEEFKEVKIGLTLNGLQYSLKNRIVNTKGHIPVQKSGYFYRALIVRPQT